MVVSCQKCRTRFQLDEGRIPAKGVRVRCSKCKHAFFVAPPGKDDDTIHGLAQQAAREGRPAKSRLDTSIDLPPVSSGEPEDDWQFNIDPPGGAGATPARGAAREIGEDRTPPPAEITDSEPTEAGAVESFFELDGLSDPGPESHHQAAPEAAAPSATGAAPKAAKGRKVAPAPIQPEQEVTFEDLGSPETWDFGVPEPSRAAKSAAAAPPAAKAKPAARAKAAATPRESAAVATRPYASPHLRADGWAGTLAGAAGWLLALALFGFGVSGVLRSPPAARDAFGPLPVGALELAELRVRHVENLHGGPLVVVSGELRNASHEPVQGVTPRLRISDASGRPIDVPPEWLGVAPTPAQLRETDPAALRAALERTARDFGSHLFAPQVSVPVAAVLSGLPPEAASFLVEAAPAERP